MQPSLDISGFVNAAPCILNPLRPHISFSGAGVKGSVYSPVCGLSYGAPIEYLPRGIGPTLCTHCIVGLFLPAVLPDQPK